MSWWVAPGSKVGENTKEPRNLMRQVLMQMSLLLLSMSLGKLFFIVYYPARAENIDLQMPLNPLLGLQARLVVLLLLAIVWLTTQQQQQNLFFRHLFYFPTLLLNITKRSILWWWIQRRLVLYNALMDKVYYSKVSDNVTE